MTLDVTSWPLPWIASFVCLSQWNLLDSLQIQLYNTWQNLFGWFACSVVVYFVCSWIIICIIYFLTKYCVPMSVTSTPTPLVITLAAVSFPVLRKPCHNFFSQNHFIHPPLMFMHYKYGFMYMYNHREKALGHWCNATNYGCFTITAVCKSTVILFKMHCCSPSLSITMLKITWNCSY